MREPVEHRVHEGFGGEHRDPLLEGQVRRKDDRAPLVAVGDDVEEEFGPACRKRHEPELVEDQEVDLPQKGARAAMGGR